MLHEFIAVNRDEIIRRCRAKVATRSIPPPTEAPGRGCVFIVDLPRQLLPAVVESRQVTS